MKSSYSKKLSPTRIAIIDLDDFADQFPGVEPGPPVFQITRVNVPPKFRGRGVGTSLMLAVCEDADEQGARLVLAINPYGEMTEEMLRDWYEGFGFEEVDGSGGLFLREPQEEHTYSLLDGF